MANGRNGKSKKNPVTVRGPWFPMPLDFLRSRAWAELSPHAGKMLFDLCSMLGYNAKGNGDLSAAPAIMEAKGWSSTATRVAAIRELIDARLVSLTRLGNRKSCALYAVTLWPLNCDFAKLEYGPGSFTTRDWEDSGKGLEQPTEKAPAKRKSLRKIEKGLPATGQPTPDIDPPRDNPPAKKSVWIPATGIKSHFSAPEVIPPRDTYLDTPSAEEGTEQAAPEPAAATAPTERAEPDKLERVRECDQEPALWDESIGSYREAPTKPANSARAGAERWVKEALSVRSATGLRR